MLRLILHSHSRIAIPPQTKFIKKLYKRRFLVGNLCNEKRRRRLVKWFQAHNNRSTKLGDLGFSKAEIGELLEKVNPSLGAYFAAVFRGYSNKQGKHRWGDKRPYYIKYLRQMFKLFPDAQFIHIVRDGRDCMASLKKMPWWHGDSIDSALNWREAIRQGQQAQNWLPDGQYFALRYEDLIADPENMVRQLCVFLEEDFEESMLDFQNTSKIAVPEYKMRWHSATREKINTKSLQRWRTDLDSDELSAMQFMAGSELVSQGYELAAIPKPGPGQYLKLKYRSFRYELNRIMVIAIDRFFDLFTLYPVDYRYSRMDS